MKEIGRKVMESVVLVLEGDFPVEVKEQVGFVALLPSGCNVCNATTWLSKELKKIDATAPVITLL